MKSFIKKKWKILLPITLLVVLPALFIGTTELLAKILPILSDVTVVSYKMEQAVYPYTGEAATPQVTEFVFMADDENEVVKSKSDIEVVSYKNNKKCGSADVEISVNGCRGTLVLKNAFRIEPAQVFNVVAVQEQKEFIQISWKEVFGADGYYIYRSEDSGVNYSLLTDINEKNVLKYEDSNIKFNANYMYYITAYVRDGKRIYEGPASESVIQYTPLETPVLTAASSVAHNANKIVWNAVPGAAGFKIYRRVNETGKFECIKELTEGTAVSYNDATCECGKKYEYYIIASQIVNAETIYGDQSNTLSVVALPNRVGLNGSTLDDYKKVSLSWQKSIGATGYQIFRSVNSSSNFTLVATIDSVDTLSWSQEGLDKHTTYYYRIRPYRVEKTQTLYGAYSSTYIKEAVIIYDYSGGTGADILRQHAGRPYLWGGATPSGWDCSGFTQWAFLNHFGISLPRTAASQASCGTSVNLNNRTEWKPGDLIFYKKGGSISHVAVYLGNGQMIHALNSKYNTLIQGVDYYESWDKNTSIYCVRRVLN